MQPKNPISRVTNLSFQRQLHSLSRKFRVSIKVNDDDRYMINLDLNQVKSVDQLIMQICKMFQIKIPLEAEVRRDELCGLVLALEPDVIIHDVETIQKEDNLFLTTKRNLRTIQ